MECIWGRVVGGEDNCELLQMGSERKETSAGFCCRAGGEAGVFESQRAKGVVDIYCKYICFPNFVGFHHQGRLEKIYIRALQ